MAQRPCMGTLQDTAPALLPGGTSTRSACVRLALAAAREALAVDPAFRPDLGFMSRAAGITPRTLQRHVAQVLRMTPRTVVERLRLDAARQTLIEGAASSVLDAAARHGFEHPGRFAIRYARAFGEAPSATLRRSRARPAPERPDAVIILRSLQPATCADATPARRATDDLAMALARAPGLAIYRDQGPGTPNAALAVEGRVEHSAVVLRILHCASGATLATHREAFGLCGGVPWTERAAGAVRCAITAEEAARARRIPLHRADVDTLVARSRSAALSQEPMATAMALDLLGEALHRDPAHPRALALASFAMAVSGHHCFVADVDGERALGIEFGLRAVALAPDDPEVLTPVAGALSLTKSLDRAEAMVQRSLALDPLQPEALRRLGFLQNFRGNGGRAGVAFNRAVAIFPHGADGASAIFGLGVALFLQGEYARAARALSRALELQPARAWPHRFLAAAAMHAGARDEALRSLTLFRRAFPDLTLARLAKSDALHPEALSRVLEGLDRAGLPR